MKKINVGLVGFGTIGAGVADILLKKREEWKKTLDIDINLKKIADLDIETDRGVNVPKELLTTNYKEIVDDPEIEIVIELVGGYDFAKKLILESIEMGKNIVTANKALLAVYGKEIFDKAIEKKVDIYYDAAVAGGIPIIKVVKEAMLANNIEKIFGIINGTCNYILTTMKNEGLSFEEALKKAQELGFAEADPTFDIDGIDSAHKLTILASLVYWREVKMEDFITEGIRKITSLDVKFAEELGYTVKLLAIARDREDGIELRVHPTLIPSKSTLASILYEFNAVMIKGNFVDELLLKGKGAGRYPTASAVVSDVIDIARNIINNSVGRVPPYHRGGELKRILPREEIITQYYLRFSSLDKPGVLAKITNILGDVGISIKAVIQKDGELKDGEYVPVVILTHKTKEGIMLKALEKFKELVGDIIESEPQILRVEEDL